MFFSIQRKFGDVNDKKGSGFRVQGAEVKLEKNRGQSVNSELYPTFDRRSISNKLIFDATQYLFEPAKNSDPEV